MLCPKAVKNERKRLCNYLLVLKNTSEDDTSCSWFDAKNSDNKWSWLYEPSMSENVERGWSMFSIGLEVKYVFIWSRTRKKWYIVVFFVLLWLLFTLAFLQWSKSCNYEVTWTEKYLIHWTVLVMWTHPCESSDWQQVMQHFTELMCQ